MAVTLDKLYISIEEKYNMKLVAGKDGLKNVIRWVHMVEDSEVPNFLHGNELIFTTGIGRLDTADKILEFVQGLQKHNAAGLVMNLGPYIKKVPTVVVDYCERNGFPLFTLPWEVKIIDITYDMCRMIIENEKSEVSATEALLVAVRAAVYARAKVISSFSAAVWFIQRFLRCRALIPRFIAALRSVWDLSVLLCSVTE